MSGSQPPTEGPPAPPVNPYETPAAPPPPPPAPVDPAAPAAPAAQPPYGDPQAPPPPPAAPSYAQPGQPQYGVPMAEPEPSKAMAITALIASLLCCTPLGFILGLVVLGRSKDGRNHGRGLAIGAIVVSVVFSLGIAAGAVALSQVDWDEVGESLLPVENLKIGECFDASNLADDDEDFVEDISEKPCDEPHDAEVLVTKDLTQDDAEGYDPSSSTLCTDLITGGPSGDKVGPDIGYFGLTTDADPNAGDKLVCVAYKIDGSKLDAPL